MDILDYILKKILNTESQKDSTSENKIIIENKNKSFEKIKELFLRFIADHMENENDISNPIDGTIEKHTIKDYEKQNYSTLQAEIKYFENQNTSVKGESVKSLAEVKIANFLFLNGIEYEYANDDKKYGPDFIIKSGEKELGLEHFSVTIDEHGNKHAAWCSEEDVYLQQMEEKISTFKDNFIYTTQDMLRNNTLLDELQEKLANNGIILKPISEDRIKECLSKLFEMNKYVALTRCKKLCYWLISEKKPTLFCKDKAMVGKIKVINDTLKEYCKKTNQQICPICHNGIITQSEDNKIKCSNLSCNCSIYACDNVIYLNHEKLSCGSSRAIIYNSKTGKWFVGCANWSQCPKRQECNEKNHILDRHYSDILDSIKPQIIDEAREKLKKSSSYLNCHTTEGD